MRADISGGTSSLLDAGDYDLHWLFTVENGSGTAVDLSGRLQYVRLTLPSPDQPIGALSVELLREPNDDGSQSLAPLMGASELNRLDDDVTFSSLLQVGRDVVCSVALTSRGGARPADGNFDEVLRGKITDVSSPVSVELGEVVTVDCLDQAGALQDTKSEASYTYDSGDSIEEAIQEVLDNNGWSSVTLYVPTATSKVLRADYVPGLQKTVWEQVQALAASIGWCCWYRYKDDGTPALTLFEPSRDKTTADFTFPKVRRVSELTISSKEIFSVLYGEITDTNGDRQTVGPVEDETSIAKYGGIRRAGWIVEKPDSPIRSTTDMEDLLETILPDLADPDALHEAITPAFPFGECSVDLYTFPANSYVYDDPQDMAPYSITVEHRIGEDHFSRIRTRGKPTAGAKKWQGRGGELAPQGPPGEQGPIGPPGEPGDETKNVIDLQRTGPTNNAFTYTITLGDDVEYAIVFWAIFNDPVPTNYLATLKTDANRKEILRASGNSFSVPVPDTGEVVRGIVVPYVENDPSGKGWEFEIIGTPYAEPITAARLAAAAVEREKILDGAVNALKLASAAVTEVKIATSAVTETKIANDAVTTPKLVAQAVTAAKIAANTITAAQIASATITADELAANSVTTAKINAGAVTSDKITVANLAAISADLGTITAGTISADVTFAGELIAATGTFHGDVVIDSQAIGNTLSFEYNGDPIGVISTTLSTLDLEGPAAKLSLGDVAALTASDDVIIGSTVNGNLQLLNIPTSNPGGTGLVWSDGGTLKIT